MLQETSNTSPIYINKTPLYFYQDQYGQWCMIQLADAGETILETAEPLTLAECQIFAERARMNGYPVKFCPYPYAFTQTQHA